MRNFYITLGILLMLFPAQLTNAKISNEKGISIQGKARTLTKPDISYCFLKIDATDKSYEVSSKKAQEKLTQLKEVLKSVLGEVPTITIFKTTNQPKGKSFDDMYQQKDFITGMAKAIKGEDLDSLETKEEKPKEMSTSVHVFFTLERFTKEKILKLRTALAEKEIAFDKSNPFSFESEYLDPNQSAIVFGLKNPQVHLETLASKAYKKALINAKTIAKATDIKLGKLIGISGCGSGLKGTVTFPGEDLIGKELGPLSADPERLSIKFSTTFEFRIK